ncbi:hypothetical protein V2G26_018511 [Clonostachys chloroleuca]
MLCQSIKPAARVASCARSATRAFVTVSPVGTASRSHKVIVIGGGSAGLTVSQKLRRSGEFAANDIAVVDPAEWHHYQAGWTLVGGGVKKKTDLRRRQKDLMHSHLKFYPESVSSIQAEENSILLGNGDKLEYEQLVIVPGIHMDYGKIKGMPEALADPSSMVSTIYGYETCDKVFKTIQKLQKGNAIFTQPAGVIKCAGAPQKLMWMALDHWKRAGLYRAGDLSSPVKISFATGLPVMFGVPKYSAKLEELRKERGVEGLFQHDLLEINGDKAVFDTPGGKVTKHFDLLHAAPKMCAHDFVKNSSIANEAGYVDVDSETTRHVRFPNVWSIGDASSLPTSKTAAAITAQAPILVRNLLKSIEGKALDAKYDGYTSCPLVTQYGKVLLTEFKYGGVPDETFGKWFGINQAVPRRAFYHMKKEFFPWVYYASMVKGTWAGPKGWSR